MKKAVDWIYVYVLYVPKYKKMINSQCENRVIRSLRLFIYEQIRPEFVICILCC